ncbi:MAG: C39 family peptidase [bacterium]|nr:C39 family peptidase [bacterium]
MPKIVYNDSMNYKLLRITILGAFLVPVVVFAAHFAGERSGYILLQVEDNGEAWYVYPENANRYYLGRPHDAFAVMRSLSLGVKHEIIANTEIYPERLSGMILLDVENNGEAYYIYPKDRKKYYLGRPDDAFRIMRELGAGIANSGLVNIPVGSINHISPPAPPTVAKSILQVVPFTSQAPFGNWADKRQQDGCEEASALMAVKWARGESLTSDKALREILGASDYIQKKYGEYRDVSAADTLNWIIKDYFKYDKATIKEDVTLQQIIDELLQGNVIVAPMNGQSLHNPKFVAPGPPNHMLVIIGYDADRKVFITNDPGTRLGKSYEYSLDVIYDAIRVYPTGYHKPIERIEKDIIVVSK